MRSENSHLLVVGSGIAGLYGALLAAESGMRVTLLTKGALAQSNTHHAQGGICAVLGPDDAAPGDTVQAHIADTLVAGAGQCDPEAVRILCSEAAADIAALERFGVVFDRNLATGKRALGLEGAHSAARILHAGGDATGAVIADGLIAAVRDAAGLGLITVLEHCFVTELLGTDAALDGMHDAGTSHRAAIAGLAYLNAADERHTLCADAVLLASGGAGQLFEFTTNPAVATGDGVALAWRAGATVGDLEYFQFHPTALAVGSNFLISEAVRGAGAVLRDGAGERFMPRYHPEGDLAPRDVVSRSIAAHLAATGQDTVYLDATGVEEAQGPGYLARRFPTIDAATAALGFDWSRQWLPVAPAAHYWMGGIATDLDGRSSLPGLYAAGEAACTGVHGANRLASNSLLEGLVFGRRAVADFVAAAAAGTSHWPTLPIVPRTLPGGELSGGTVPESAVTRAELSRSELRHLLSSQAGVVRDAAGLRQAATALAGALPEAQGTRRKEAEDNNLRLVAHLLVQAALVRENSVGAHYRSDFPQPPVPVPSGPARDSHFWFNPAPTLTPAQPQRESETV